MRIDEILSSNQIMINLKKMKTSFVAEFNDITEYHLLIIKSKSIVRHRRLLGNIELLENEICVL